MKHFFLILLAIFISASIHALPEEVLTKGMVIKNSITITKQTYNLNADSSLSQPLIIIEGNNITVDFNNAVLQGSNDVHQPNEFYGLAILIKKGSHNISLLNANIHGFKVAVMVDGIDSLIIDHCNFSYNYRQKLYSNWQREDISDWMSYHHNENDEWLRYGAGIYLKDCEHAVIKNNLITGGQCGLMMVRCNNNEVYSNNFSFNSGIGIGLYRSSNNRIYANSLDFNVRGYSDGIYSRGQDSGGILVFEQCNNNVFAYNSATHSGDGFFLWAGQYTMDTGEGGCNDNWIYNNDFSYAPANGVEVTFSKNHIEQNIIKECDYGIWAGYSYETNIAGNILSSNKTGIAIEHGKDNFILKNQFTGGSTAVKLWATPNQPSDWVYPKKRDTRSINYLISGNHFSEIKTVFDIAGSDSIKFLENSKTNCSLVYKFGKNTTHIDTLKEHENKFSEELFDDSASLDRIKIKTIPVNDFPSSRSSIHITDWGPYDFQYPVALLKNIDSNSFYHFEILGPKDGKIKIKKSNGFSYSIIPADTEQVANNIYATVNSFADDTMKNRFIQFEYRGPAFTDIFGVSHEANKPYTFEYSEFNPHSLWDIAFYKWDEQHAPDKSFSGFMQALSTPVYKTVTNKIDYTWWGSIGNNLPQDSFATIATTTMNLPESEYEISVTADDYVKIYIDRKLVIDAWDKHFTDLDENTHHTIKIFLEEGNHDFKIVHAENMGLADLMFYIKPLKDAKEENKNP